MTKRFLTSVVAGKFRPFHKGHKRVIEAAVKESTMVYILLVRSPSDQWNPQDRALAIYETFAGDPVKVFIVDDILADDETYESSIAWAAYTANILGFYPDAVFSSEDYGVNWAKEMGAEHVMVDHDRVKVPVSGSEISAHPYENSKYLVPSMARYMLPRVVVLGAESTGTTTLANALGEHYDTDVVPEYGRLIDEDLMRRNPTLTPEQVEATWNDDKFRLVARSQEAMEERAARFAHGGVLICDTDSLATSYWADYYHRKGAPVSQYLGEAMRVFSNGARAYAKEHHSLYILTYDDIPFQQDNYGLRQGENLRKWMTEQFMKELTTLRGTARIPFIVVRGSHDDRLKAAIQAVEEVIHQPATALDKSFANALR